jgi:methyl coenzyme M reductase subunit D
MNNVLLAAIALLVLIVIFYIWFIASFVKFHKTVKEYVYRMEQISEDMDRAMAGLMELENRMEQTARYIHHHLRN